MKKIIITSFLLSFYNITSAQFSETISSDRPGQAFGPNSVGKFILQTQTGIDFGGYKFDKNTYGSSYTPNTFIKYGVTEKIDIHTSWAYNQQKSYDYGFNSSYSGLSYSSVGTRLNVMESDGNKPALGVFASVKLPILAQAYNFNNIAPQALIILGNSITENLNYTINLGLDFDGNGNSPIGLYVANVGYSLSSSLFCFVENYGNFGNGFFQHRFDGGIGYQANKNLQLDVYGGLGNNDEITDYFSSIGISWRFTSIRDKKLNTQPH